MQIKYKEIKEYREKYTKEQKGICPICGCNLSEAKVHLDHSHTTGDLRGALCSHCNEMEGKITNSRYRTPRSHLVWVNQLEWLAKLLSYLGTTAEKPSGIIHPTFDTTTGKQKVRKRRRRNGPRRN